MATLHSYQALWDTYPDYGNYRKPEQVKKLIGGEVNEPMITNTCAVRLSRALNYTGLPVPGNFAGLHTVRGKDGKRYAFRVREIHKWLDFTLGQPDFDTKKKEGDAFDKRTLSAMKGIIGFDIRFSDATGHLDLWDGSTFTDEYQMSRDYWTSATRIWVWIAEG